MESRKRELKDGLLQVRTQRLQEIILIISKAKENDMKGSVCCKLGVVIL